MFNIEHVVLTVQGSWVNDRSMTKELHSTHEIIDKLGGEYCVAEMVGVTPKAVNNWSNWDLIPRGYYGRMLWELNQRGWTAKPQFWGQLACNGLRIRHISK